MAPVLVQNKWTARIAVSEGVDYKINGWTRPTHRQAVINRYRFVCHRVFAQKPGMIYTHD